MEWSAIALLYVLVGAIFILGLHAGGKQQPKSEQPRWDDYAINFVAWPIFMVVASGFCLGKLANFRG